MNDYASICKSAPMCMSFFSRRLIRISYVLYHSLLAIVRESYRPLEDGDEMEARRNLTTAIRQLSSA